MDTSIIRFGVVGVTNTLISFLVFTTLMRTLPDWAWRATLAQAVSYGAGMAWSFFWNRAWTFQAKGKRIRQGVYFFATQTALLALSTAALGLLVDYFGYRPTLCWIAVMGVSTALNFITQKYWVFDRI